MRTIINHSPTESRRLTFLTHVKDSKRIHWSNSRPYLHLEA
ncbi:hypothetical protein [Maribacter caenipelagi]|nr:hypothetical protein [Maribacter caenipelagi]